MARGKGCLVNLNRRDAVSTLARWAFHWKKVLGKVRSVNRANRPLSATLTGWLAKVIKGPRYALSPQASRGTSWFFALARAACDALAASFALGSARLGFEATAVVDAD